MEKGKIKKPGIILALICLTLILCFSPAVVSAVPHACFSYTTSGLTVEVDASCSFSNISLYLWYWGDNSATDTGVTASHTYDSSGTYMIRLDVVGDELAVDSAYHEITVPAGGSSGFSIGFDNTTLLLCVVVIMALIVGIAIVAKKHKKS